MELWIEILRRLSNGELSKRAACTGFGIHWETLQKILTHTEPPGYRLTKKRPSKLEPFLPSIHEMLDGDRKSIASSGTRLGGFSKGCVTSTVTQVA